MTTQRNSTGRGKQGFASMDEARQRQIASMGGKAAHEKGTAHEWTSEEARVAGRKGGQANRGGHVQAASRGGNGSAGAMTNQESLSAHEGDNVTAQGDVSGRSRSRENHKNAS